MFEVSEIYRNSNSINNANFSNFRKIQVFDELYLNNYSTFANKWDPICTQVSNENWLRFPFVRIPICSRKTSKPSAKSTFLELPIFPQNEKKNFHFKFKFDSKTILNLHLDLPTKLTTVTQHRSASL